MPMVLMRATTATRRAVGPGANAHTPGADLLWTAALAASLPSTASARQCGDGWTYLAPSMGLTAADQEAVYDSGRDRLVVLIGLARQTWEFDFGTLSWSLRDTANGPSARDRFGMAYDANRGVTVLHGGRLTPVADTWEWNGTSWTRILEGLPNDMGEDPTLAYDPITRKVMRYGGYHWQSLFGGDWIIRSLGFWSGSDWSSAGTSSLAVMAPSLVSDPVQGFYMVSGGRIPSGGGPAQSPGSGTAVSAGAGWQIAQS